MATIFTKIINGEIPCYKIAEDENYFAFLDIRPVVKGHTLVVPKKETDYIFDLDDVTLSDMMIFAKKVSKALQQVVPCQRIALMVLGLEVPHAHIHLLPIQNEAEFNIRNKHTFPDNEMQTIARDVQKILSNL
jgi:histidine triad (HIT) family protein